MKQRDLGLYLSTQRTRKRIFLDDMQRVVLLRNLLALITPHSPVAKPGRPPFLVESMLHIKQGQVSFYKALRGIQREGFDLEVSHADLVDSNMPLMVGFKHDS
jgi:hypothetical protein